MGRRSAVVLLWGLALAGAALGPAGAAAQPPDAPGRVTAATAGGEVTVLADRLEEVTADNLIIATGNVEVTRGTARLLADRVELNTETGAVVAEGRVLFYDGENRLTGERIEYNFRTGTGVVYEGRARAAPYYRLGGERMERFGESLYRVRRGTFTTCEGDPPAWSVRFGSATVDLEEGFYGTSASFWVRSIPVVPFIPFFAAAIRRERQTGFLFPRGGVSSFKGTFAEIPFFWAISDSQDATITLNVYGDRGLGTDLRYRYLLSETHRGEIAGFYLNEMWVDENEISPDEQEGRDANRAYARLRHEWLLTPDLSFKADLHGVSDDFVFRDYGDALATRSAQRVDSDLFLTWNRPAWNVVGSLFAYQDLTTRRPVELHRLPEITVNRHGRPIPWLPGVLWDLETSGTRVVRDVGSDGTRLDLHPRLFRPIPVGGYFTVTPFLRPRLTAYDATVTGTRITQNGGFVVEETADDERLRSLLEAGTDIEARASRIYGWGGWAGIDAVLHTIEPRVNYTWLDGNNLDRIPDWGSPIDLIEHTHRVTYALTNRLLARSVAPEGMEARRWEAMRFTVAHSYDLTPGDRPLGELLADLILDPGQVLRFRGQTAVDVHGDGVQTAITDLTVRLPALNAAIGTRYSEPDDVNFVRASLLAELNPFVVGRVSADWDVRTDTFVEGRVGVDLRWQCWALTIEFVSRSEREDEVRFGVNLLGVGAPLTVSAGIGALTGGGEGGVR